MVHMELKKAIINWLFDNQKQFQIISACVSHFRQYIYLPNGEHCIGGKEVYDFIKDAEKLIRQQ